MKSNDCEECIMGTALIDRPGDVRLWENGTASDVVAGDVVNLGDRVGVANVVIPVGENGNVSTKGVLKAPLAAVSPSAGEAAYWDPTAKTMTNVAAAGLWFAGWFDRGGTSGDTDCWVRLDGFAAGGAAVSGLATGFGLPVESWRRATEPNEPLPTEVVNWPVALEQARIFDEPGTPVGPAGGAPSADDLGLNDGGWLTAGPALSTQDLKAAGATTEYALIQRQVPADYEPGTALSLRVNAGMNTTAADGSAFVDLEVVRAAAPTVDINTTVAQSINSLIAADFDFILTPTDLVPGDVVNSRVAVTVTDAGGVTAVLGQVYSAELVPSNAHLLVVDPGHGVGNPTLETGDVDSLGAVTRTGRFQFQVRDHYVAGGAAVLRLNANMKTNPADTAATIDAVVVRAADPTTDINPVAAQDMNFLAVDDYDFALDATNLVPGDLLDVVVTVAVNDGATGAPVIGVVNPSDCELLLDVKG
jgi:predicted RecA/RadA family phage recombinase